MSEHVFGKAGKYGADSFEHIFPPDPYSDIGLHFQALQDMGYPVQIEPVPEEDLATFAGTRLDDVYFQYDLRTHSYQGWLRPVVMDQQFERFIYPTSFILEDYPDDSLEMFIVRHPIEWLAHIATGDSSQLALEYDRCRAEGGIIRDMLTFNTVNIPSVIERCFMTAHNRMRNWWSSDSDYPAEVNDMYSARAGWLYQDLGKRNVRPYGPFELMQLVEDYYLMFADRDEEFAAYDL